MALRFAIGVLFACALGTIGLVSTIHPWVDPGPDSAKTLCRLLAARGLEVRPGQVHAIDIGALGPAGASTLTRWVALGRRRGSRQDDVFLVLARKTPSGRVLGVADLTNVTRSFGASERELVVDGTTAAFVVASDGVARAVTMLDFRGEPAELTASWNAFGRFANAVSNYQVTGQPQGVGRRRYDFARPVSGPVELLLERGRLTVSLPSGEVCPDGRLVIDRRTAQPQSCPDLVRVRPSAKGRPGLIGWAVDTLRAVTWIGPSKIEWLEHKFFRLTDLATRSYHRVAPEQTAQDIALEMGLGPMPAQAGLDEAPDPMIGWPPEELAPMDLPRRYATEGRWAPLAADEFVPGSPDGPPLFATTWLRADPNRQYARVYVVAWDPRMVELRMRSGAAEPVDETGATGTGEVPRDPDVLRRLVGGFNGGFQAIHGEWGIMEDGRVFLPPKPWAATVATFADGSVGFGTWPEELPTVPEEMVSYRQNMTPLVADGSVNPYGRSWWGAAPPQAPDQVHTVRTGMCMMQDGFVAYLWGSDLSHEALASAMELARCEYGIHLDMNMGLCGFELYRVFERGSVQALGRLPEADFEAEGDVEGAAGLKFRARRLTRSMNAMNFPRYVGREQRDFFYLLERRILPGPRLEPPITPALEGEGMWIVRGLPHNGFPWAFARTFVRPLPERPDARVLLVRIDPDRVRTDDSVRAPVLLGAIELGSTDASLAARSDALDVRGLPLSEASSVTTVAIGVDALGYLVYAEGPDRDALAAAMQIARVAAPRSLGASARLEFHVGAGRVARLDGGTPVPLSDRAVRLYAATDTPSARRIFTQVPFAPPRVWQAKQGQRVRYHRGRR